MAKIFFFIFVTCVFLSCSKEERYTTRISGTWEMEKLERSEFDSSSTLVKFEVQSTDFKLSFFDNEGTLNRLFYSGDSLTKTFFDTEIDQIYKNGYSGIISYKMNEESPDRLDFNEIICTVTKLNRRKLEFHFIGIYPGTGTIWYIHSFYMKRSG